jgi:transposase InsO family protein/transposase-like protein
VRVWAGIPLPKHWSEHVRSAVLHVISLAQLACAYTRGWAADSPNVRVRLTAEKDRLQQDHALLREQMRIKDERMACLAPHQRPHDTPNNRMAILQMRAARGWSLEQTAREFLVTAGTVSSWRKRLEEAGPDALVQVREPVNRFPDFLRYTVQQMKALCPSMGKVKTAETLARAGLHLGRTTVGRIKEQPQQREPTRDSPDPPNDDANGCHSSSANGASPAPTASVASAEAPRVVTAKYPDHVWHVDLTVVPTALGFWTSFWPFALPQCWPFCWWVAVVVDHFSRRAVGFAVFAKQPHSVSVRTSLGRLMATVKATPKHLICNKGAQFWCDGFKRWCQRHAIRPCFGAIGQHGSIAVVERFILTLKNECTRRLLVPYGRRAFRRELAYFFEWYNEHRPHMTLRGRTPNEVYHRRAPLNRQPRFEPRPAWPRPSPCAQPQVLVKGQPGAHVTIRVD